MDGPQSSRRSRFYKCTRPRDAPVHGWKSITGNGDSEDVMAKKESTDLLESRSIAFRSARFSNVESNRFRIEVAMLLYTNANDF